MNFLHEKGYISKPATKAKSVAFTEEGGKLSKELFEKLFATKGTLRLSSLKTQELRSVVAKKKMSGNGEHRAAYKRIRIMD
jgi:hypothetical protein